MEFEDLPEIIRQGLHVNLVGFNVDGDVDAGEMDIDGVVNLLHEVRLEPSKILGKFIKIQQGLNALVYQYSNAIDDKTLEKKALEAELQSLYSRKDGTNPLYVNGQKLTNANIEAEIHRDKRYKEIENSLKRYTNYKSYLLTTYSVLNKTFDAAIAILGLRESKGLSDSIRDRVAQLANSAEE